MCTPIAIHPFTTEACVVRQTNSIFETYVGIFVNRGLWHVHQVSSLGVWTLFRDGRSCALVARCQAGAPWPLKSPWHVTCRTSARRDCRPPLTSVHGGPEACLSPPAPHLGNIKGGTLPERLPDQCLLWNIAPLWVGRTQSTLFGVQCGHTRLFTPTWCYARATVCFQWVCHWR